jgi:hypothetical protein
LRWSPIDERYNSRPVVGLFKTGGPLENTIRIELIIPDEWTPENHHAANVVLVPICGDRTDATGIGYCLTKGGAYIQPRIDSDENLEGSGRFYISRKYFSKVCCFGSVAG